MGLSITVQKGHDFSSGNVTRAALNAGATPTVAMTGSVGGSEIATDSISNTHVAADADIAVSKLALTQYNIVIGDSNNNGSVLAPNSAGLESTDNDVEGNVGFLCDNGTSFSVLRTDLNTAGGHVGVKKTSNNLKLIINTGIVDGNHLKSSIFDNETIGRTNAALHVKDGGITLAKLASSSGNAGFFTYGQGGNPEELVTTSTNMIPVTQGSADPALKGYCKTIDVASSMSVGTWMRQNHSYPNQANNEHPHIISAYYECVTAEYGYVAGDRIYNIHPINEDSHASLWYVDATNVGHFLPTTGSLPDIYNKTTGAAESSGISAAKWKPVVVMSEYT